MRTWIAPVRRIILSEDGPTAVEYAVMMALILLGCFLVITNLGTTVSGSFSKATTAFGS